MPFVAVCKGPGLKGGLLIFGLVRSNSSCHTLNKKYNVPSINRKSINNNSRITIEITYYFVHIDNSGHTTLFIQTNKIDSA